MKFLFPLFFFLLFGLLSCQTPVGSTLGSEQEVVPEPEPASYQTNSTLSVPGTEFILGVIDKLEADSSYDAPKVVKNATIGSLSDWFHAYSELVYPSFFKDHSLALSRVDDQTHWLVQFIINWGDLVLLFQEGRICNDEEVAFYSTEFNEDGLGATCEDAASIDENSYWALYHQAVALTDWNDPRSQPPLDATAFRLLFKEDSALKSLAESLYHRRYSFSQIFKLVTEDLGYSFHTQSRDGQIQPQSFSESQMQTYLSQIASEVYRVMNHKSYEEFQNYLRKQRFHVPYNPAGGQFLDAVYFPGESTKGCFPYKGGEEALTDCQLQLKRYDLSEDLLTITENPQGDYYLQWDYENGYTDKGYLREWATSRYVRDKRYRILEFDIDAGASMPAYVYNKRYDESLDPLLCGDGLTLPFSNEDWLEHCSDKDFVFVPNAYVMPNPELLSRVLVVVSGITDWQSLNSFQAYAVIKLMLQGIIAFPFDVNQEPPVYALLTGIDQSASEIDLALKNFFDSGVAGYAVYAAGDVAIQNAHVGTQLHKNDKLKKNAKMMCQVQGEGQIWQDECEVKIDLTIVPEPEGIQGGLKFKVQGQVEIVGRYFVKEKINVNELWVYDNGENSDQSGLIGRFAGENGFVMTFSFSENIFPAIYSAESVSGKADLSAFQVVSKDG